jgi:hypothetical protein
MFRFSKQQSQVVDYRHPRCLGRHAIAISADLTRNPDTLALRPVPLKKGVRFIFPTENKPDTFPGKIDLTPFFLATLPAWFAAIRGVSP